MFFCKNFSCLRVGKNSRGHLQKSIPPCMLREMEEETRLNETQILSLYHQFRKLAPKGSLSIDGFRQAMGCLGFLDNSFLSNRLFTVFDTSGNNLLSFVEFAVALGIMIAGTEDEKLSLAFRILNVSSYTCKTQEIISNHVTAVEEIPVVKFDDFKKVILSIQASRKELVGWFPDNVNEEFLKDVFNQVSHFSFMCEPVLRLEDFKMGIATNETFLSLFLMTLSPQDQKLKHFQTVPSSDLFLTQHAFGVRRCQTIHCSSQALNNTNSFTMKRQSLHFDVTKYRWSILGDPYYYKNETLYPCTSSSFHETNSDEKDSFKQSFSFYDCVSPSISYPCPSIQPKVSDTFRKSKSFPFFSKLKTKASLHLDQPLSINHDVSYSNLTKLQYGLNEGKETKSDQSSVNLVTRKKKRKFIKKKSWNLLSSVSSDFPLLSPPSKNVSSDTSCIYKLFDNCRRKLPSFVTNCHAIVPETIVKQLSNNILKKQPLIHSSTVSGLPCESSTHHENHFLKSNSVYTNPFIFYQKDSVTLPPFFYQADPHSSSQRPCPRAHTIEKFKSYHSNSCEIQAQPINSLHTSHSKFPFQKKSTVTSGNKFSMVPKPLLKDQRSCMDKYNCNHFQKSKTTYLPSSRMYMNRPTFRKERKRQGSIAHIQERLQRCRPEYKLFSPTKGYAIYFGHRSWNMVLNMMIGIRLAGKLVVAKPSRSIIPSDFTSKSKINITEFLRKKSLKKYSKIPCRIPLSSLPATFFLKTISIHVTHLVVQFIDYAPMVFQQIRHVFGLNSEEYFLSLGPEQVIGNMVLGNLASLSELCTEGQSGAFFYYSSDGKYMIKTITRGASKFLKKLLKDYYHHISTHTDTLITRFYGFHAIYKKKSKLGAVTPKIYFIIMNNVFHTPVALNRRYDLKGSWEGRFIDEISKQDPSIALKDNDMISNKEKICVGKEYRKALLNVIETDVRFFSHHRIIDYSLVVGIHESRSKCFNSNASYFDDTTSVLKMNWVHSTDKIPPSVKPFHQKHLGGIISSDGRTLYYLGIVDILTCWTILKKIERGYKILWSEKMGAGISCAPPNFYANRFITFLSNQIE